MILGDDIYFTYRNAEGELKGRIKNVYKINEDTINQAIEETLKSAAEKEAALFEATKKKKLTERLKDKLKRKKNKELKAYVTGRSQPGTLSGQQQIGQQQIGQQQNGQPKRSYIWRSDRIRRSRSR